MDTQKPQFNRILIIILAVLYVIIIAIFSYTNWTAAPAGFMQWWMVPLNILILSIPLVSMGGSIYVLAIAWREHSVTGKLNLSLAKIIRWAPRVAAILIIFFMTLFSFDVFEVEASPLELLGGFLMHNIPSIGMLVLLLFAWRRPVVGFVGFLVVAALFIIFFVRDIYDLSLLIFFVFPILLAACLFYAAMKWLTQPYLGQTDKVA